MLPGLQAEESITTTNSVALGTGSLREDDARALSRDIRQAVESIRPRKPAQKPTPGALASMGIAVVTAPKGGVA